MPTPTIRQVIAGVGNSVNVTLTLSSAQIGDTVLLIDTNNWYTLAGRPNPSGTAVSSWGTALHTLDGGTNDGHAKVWMGTVTTAGGTVITSPNSDEELYAVAVVFVGGNVAFDGAASTDSDTTGTSHIAPDPGTPTTANDVLVCAWFTASDLTSNLTNYTLPGGMTAAGGEQDSAFHTGIAAYEVLSSAAAPGTRTATASPTRFWCALSVLVQDTGGGGGAVAPTLRVVRSNIRNR